MPYSPLTNAILGARGSRPAMKSPRSSTLQPGVADPNAIPGASVPPKPVAPTGPNMPNGVDSAATAIKPIPMAGITPAPVGAALGKPQGIMDLLDRSPATGPTPNAIQPLPLAPASPVNRGPFLQPATTANYTASPSDRPTQPAPQPALNPLQRADALIAQMRAQTAEMNMSPSMRPDTSELHRLSQPEAYVLNGSKLDRDAVTRMKEERAQRKKRVTANVISGTYSF